MQIQHVSTRSGVVSIRFGTTDIRDLSDGALPAQVVIVMTRDCTGKQEEEVHARVRTEKQKLRRAREAAQGWVTGWTKHVEIRAYAGVGQLRG